MGMPLECGCVGMRHAGVLYSCKGAHTIKIGLLHWSEREKEKEREGENHTC